MREFIINITAKFDEEELKKALSLDYLDLTRMPQIITEYIANGKKDRPSSVGVSVKQLGTEEVHSS